MEFQAEWLWLDDTQPCPPNTVVQFRRTFHLATLPEQALLHISADTRYILYVNGERWGYGPVRAYHTNYAYDTYDIASALHSGDNCLAISVHHWGEGTFQQRVGRGGCIAQLDLTDQAPICTDASWLVKRDAAYRQRVPRIAIQLPWEEQYDARLADDGWTLADYDATSWGHAQVLGSVGMAPWGELRPRAVPFLTDEPISPVRVSDQGTVRLPAAQLAAHLAPTVAPHDVTANRHKVDLLLAAVLHVPTAGMVTLRLCGIYGEKPLLWFAGDLLGDASASFHGVTDLVCDRELAAGDYPVLVDWRGTTHDLDVTLTAAGIAGLRLTALGGEPDRWSIARAPAASREAARHATTVALLQACGADWHLLAQAETPETDVMMTVRGSIAAAPAAQPTVLPLDVPPTPATTAHHYLLDFGRMLVGWLDFTVTATAGTVIDIVGYEGMHDHALQPTEQMNNSLRYICRDGSQRFVSSQRRGLRYLIIAIHDAPAPVTLHQVQLRLATHPAPTQRRWHSADPRIDAIWQACAYTLRLCTEDTFTDCPTYEQAMWIGDAYIDTLVHQTINGDARVAAYTLQLAAESLREQPIVNAQSPSDWNAPDAWIPNWSWFWVLGCREYFWLTGDTAFVHTIFPALAQQADWLCEHLARHPRGFFILPDTTHLLDWVEMDEAPESIVAHEQMLAVAALRATADLAEVLDATAAALTWRARAEQLTDAINACYWSPAAQAYVDSLHADGTLSTHVSQPVNALALVTGVASVAQRLAIMPHLATPPATWARCGSPWMFSLLLMEFARQGESTTMLRLLRDRWGGMLDQGATTIWETFPGWEGEGRFTRSWCHAWGTLPAYLLPAFIVGIRPLVPGFARVQIAPQLGDLAWAEATVPTPHGDIFVNARSRDRQHPSVVTLTLPAEVAGEIVLPAKSADAPPRASDPRVLFTRAGAAWQAALPQGTQVTIWCDAAL